MTPERRSELLEKMIITIRHAIPERLSWVQCREIAEPILDVVLDDLAPASSQERTER